MDTSHLNALNLNLSNERRRLSAAKTDAEHQIRSVWVAQLENEIKQERALLGLPPEDAVPNISEDELLAELGVFDS